jgi:polysaccharide biosynthesis protein PelF
MSFPQPHPQDRPVRILFVFAWLVPGGEETEVRLLARHIDRARFRIDVIPCMHAPRMPDQTCRQLAGIGVSVDRTALDLSLDETVAYLARKIPGYEIIVSCQNVADIYPAMERLRHRPPLIEHGRLVGEALAGPKHLTTRYVGVCETIRAAAAARMPDRPQHARLIPSMVDLGAFDPALRRLGRPAGPQGTGRRFHRGRRAGPCARPLRPVHRGRRTGLLPARRRGQASRPGHRAGPWRGTAVSGRP